MRVRSKNKCSCCQKSSSDRPSSDDPSSHDPSSTDPSSTSRELGRCCSIPKKYVVDEEVFESNDFETAQEWIRSQRSGREEVGYLFHGPIRLRFDGGWYVAVICLGEQSDDGTCDCDIQPEIYDCSETDDPGYCYYLAGIPGLGVFTPGGDCDCDESGGEGQANTSQGCDKCGDTFRDCELGCGENGCSCCWEPPPPAGADGVVCTKRFRLLSYEGIKQDWPEILQQGDCNNPNADPNSAWGRLVEYCSEALNVERDSIRIARMRDSSEPCRIEVWGECSCLSQANMQPDTQCGAPQKPKIYAKGSGGDFSVEQGCECSDSCKDDCHDKDTLSVDVLDQWQAEQIGGEWKDGECPRACCPDETDCDESVLVPKRDEIYEYDENFVDGVESTYNLMNGDSGPAPVEGTDFVWNDGYPNSLCNYRWVTERTDTTSFVDFITDNATIYASTCFRAYLISCDPEESAWIDVTEQAVTGLPGVPDEWGFCTNDTNPDKDLEVESLIDWGMTQSFPISGVEESCFIGCNEMPTWNDIEPFSTGAFGDTLPLSFGNQFKKVEERSMPAKTKTGGAGTELTKLLRFFGIKATEKGCKCKSRAAKMDKNGVEWCSNNVEKICDWLQEEAQKRKLPFVRTAAKIIVLRAIRNARSKGFE